METSGNIAGNISSDGFAVIDNVFTDNKHKYCQERSVRFTSHNISRIT